MKKVVLALAVMAVVAGGAFADFDLQDANSSTRSWNEKVTKQREAEAARKREEAARKKEEAARKKEEAARKKAAEEAAAKKAEEERAKEEARKKAEAYGAAAANAYGQAQNSCSVDENTDACIQGFMNTWRNNYNQ